MADPLDVITLAEAHAALPGITGTGSDTELAAYITAVSRRLDELCGPIVIRTITNERYDFLSFRDKRLTLRNAPSSRTSATTITSVTEYSSGTATVLAQENLTNSTGSDYRFDAYTGILYRQGGWYPTSFAPTVVVTYQAGRYADTASVDAKFKKAATMMVSMLWRREEGQGSSVFPGGIEPESIVQGATYAVPNAVKELLADELRGPIMASA